MTTRCASRNYEIASCKYEIVSRNYEIAFRKYEIVSRYYEIVSRNYEIAVTTRSLKHTTWHILASVLEPLWFVNKNWRSCTGLFSRTHFPMNFLLTIVNLQCSIMTSIGPRHRGCQNPLWITLYVCWSVRICFNAITQKNVNLEASYFMDRWRTSKERYIDCWTKMSKVKIILTYSALLCCNAIPQKLQTSDFILHTQMDQ